MSAGLSDLGRHLPVSQLLNCLLVFAKIKLGAYKHDLGGRGMMCDLRIPLKRFSRYTDEKQDTD